MQKRWRFRAAAALAGVWGTVAVCVPAVAQDDPGESAVLFAAAIDRLARDARGRLLVDPRPLRADADLRGIQDEDFARGAEAVARMRARALADRGITTTDAVLDQRCTFTEGIGPLPGRESRLADSIRTRTAACLAREPYTTLVLGLPRPVEGAGYPAGTWRVSARVMDRSGFVIWDLYLRAGPPSGWTVIAAERRFGIQS